MKNFFPFIIAFAVLIFSACDSGNQKSKEQTQGKGGIKYGGMFRYNETEYFKTLYPLSITEVVGHHIVTQIYEGLVGFNPKDLTIDPMLAESWTVDSSFTTYKFKIRKGVMFHDDACFKDGKGRAVTANDFVYCYNLLCTPDSKNNGFAFFRDIVKGATALYTARQNKAGEAEALAAWGVKALDDSTLQVTLEKPYADLLNRLALPFCWVFPKEAVDYYKGQI
jgi:oligopeptide transport system substrate-binding protein